MQPTTMLPKLSDTTQTISFSEGDGMCSSEVFASDVVVATNAGAHNHGSSKVKLKSLVDYNWENKHYSGQLLAIHMAGKYLAYSIKAPNTVNPGTWSGMVRVVHSTEPGTDRRALIKGMKGEVQDLAFAHIESEVILACVDEQGNFYVHKIELTDSGLRCTALASVREDTGCAGPHRVLWCPYIPDEDEGADEDVARLLLTAHDMSARMWNMRVVCAQLASAPECRGEASALLRGAGVVATSEHGAAIVHAAFSPDGTALATASQDGTVMFFQVYMQNDASPRCLHKWQPHAGKPLSCLFFLDNHKNYNADVQFWKFAVTGAENNTILKIWSCKTWSCLQTITFTPALGPEPSTLGLKAMLDTSASYLLLSDSKARSLYVLNMARDSDDTMAYCKNISEFLLPYPVLSFCIVDAGEQPASCESSCDDPYHRNGSGGDAASPDDFDLQAPDEAPATACLEARVRVRLYIVQPKGLQQGELCFTQPPAAAAQAQAQAAALSDGLAELSLGEEASEPAPAAIASSILQQQSQQLKNLLMRSQTQPGSLIGQRAESPPLPPPLNLMTPDAFSSPGKRDEDDPPLSATPDVSGKPRSSTGGYEEAAAVGKFTSGGSSPSREVQEIMASSDEHEYYKEQLTDEASQSPAAEEPLPAVTAVNGEPGYSEPGYSEPAYSEPGYSEPSYVQSDVFVSPEHSTQGKLAHSNLYEQNDVFESPVQPPAPNLLAHTNNEWPEVPLAQMHRQNDASQRKCSSDKPVQCLNSVPVPHVPGQSVEAPGEGRSGLTAEDRNKIDQLELKLDKLTDLMQQQSRSLRTLQSTVQSPRDLVEQALQAHTQRTTAAIESALSDGWERVALSGEAWGARAAAAAGAGAARALEPLAQALQYELAAKLTSTDQLLRDNIDKLVNSKTIMERLSGSIASSLADMVRASFRDAMAASVVPAMEKAHANIFRQINHAFQAGTKEFAAHTEAAARAAAERGGAAATAALRAALERHEQALQQHAQHSTAPHLAPALREAAHDVLEKEMCWWREQARGVVLQMSRAHSPATPASSHTGAMDRQMQVNQIQSLMNSGDVNGAFQLALSASDLTLVMLAARAADPAAVFAPPGRLKQHVLLSLVQQLAADMTKDTALKHRYLEEAIMNLDTSNAVTREHLPVVIRELQKQIMAFLGANPGHQLSRQFKMLLMATESLVKGGV